jgi:phosphoserine phosphatase
MQQHDTPTAVADGLISWNDSAAKKSLVEFISRVTEPGSPDFVPPLERIAVFDNDGTLWVEQPLYVQGFFVLDRIKALAPQHPEWRETEPFASVLKGDLPAALAGGESALAELVMATHAGMTTEEFEQIAADWIATARHPLTGRLHTEMGYQPMLELLTCLRANGFTVWIASAGGIEFMRPWTERVYGIPRENVIGSSIKTKYELRDGRPVLVRLPELNFFGDKAGKPVGIQQHIGRRPIAAFGNSDGDFEMLEWVTSVAGLRFGLFVHHDDAVREYAYERAAVTGHFDRGLAEAPGRGWIVVSMKRDWKRVFAFETG